MDARKRIVRTMHLLSKQKSSYKRHSSIAPWAVAGMDLFASCGICARALLGSSAGFTLPYFELAERAWVLAPSGTTTAALLLLAEQLGSTAITIKIVARIVIRLLITFNPFRALTNNSNQDTRRKITAPRMILHTSVAPIAPLLAAGPARL